MLGLLQLVSHPSDDITQTIMNLSEFRRQLRHIPRRSPSFYWKEVCLQLLVVLIEKSLYRELEKTCCASVEK